MRFPFQDPEKEMQRRKNVSKSLTGKYTGEKHPFFGKHHTEETKELQREAGKKFRHNQESKDQISRNQQGEKNHNFGISIPIETRQRMSLSHRTEKNLLQTVERKLGGFWYGNVRYYDGPQYCEKFNENLKERVRAFFGYRCVECGAPQSGRKLHVHHVHYNKKMCCDGTPRSLVPLCHKCHSKTTAGDRAYWSSHFQEMIDMYYGGRCWLTIDEMMNTQPGGGIKYHWHQPGKKTPQGGRELPGLM
jgi:hypothetical protein